MMSIRNNIIERKGVNAIDRVFTNMGWIFRENPHTDYGIDGDVEQVIDDELTGRHIALQIKSGDSYLKENKGGRITFYIDEWHYKYWLQYDRPVIILFYDEVNDKVIWDQVKLSKVTNTNTQFKIEINPDKILNDSVLPELNSIISSYTSHKFYELTNEFDNFEFSLFCYQELNRSIRDFCPELQHFKDVICAQGLNPNTGILITSIDHFRKKLQSSSQTDYELLHKGCWYLKTMANHIPFLLFETLRSKVREYISVIDLNIQIWGNIKRDINVLIHPNIPETIQQSVLMCIGAIENRIAAFKLVRKEYENCVNIVNLREGNE